jgi:hypothetical protein
MKIIKKRERCIFFSRSSTTFHASDDFQSVTVFCASAGALTEERF